MNTGPLNNKEEVFQVHSGETYRIWNPTLVIDWIGKRLDPAIRSHIDVGNLVQVTIHEKFTTEKGQEDWYIAPGQYYKVLEKSDDGWLLGMCADPYQEKILESDPDTPVFVYNGQKLWFKPEHVSEIPLDEFWTMNANLIPFNKQVPIRNTSINNSIKTFVFGKSLQLDSETQDLIEKLKSKNYTIQFLDASPETFQGQLLKILEDNKLEKDEILYIDNDQAKVDAAIALDIDGLFYTGFDSLKSVLADVYIYQLL